MYEVLNKINLVCRNVTARRRDACSALHLPLCGPVCSLDCLSAHQGQAFESMHGRPAWGIELASRQETQAETQCGTGDTRLPSTVRIYALSVC